MFGLSPSHLLLLLVIVVLIFGTKKLRNMGGDLGAAVKGFKDGVKGDEAKTGQVEHTPRSLTDEHTTESKTTDRNPSA